MVSPSGRFVCVALSCALGCAGETAAPASAQRPSVGIGVRTRTFDDATRGTPANGGAPATSSRHLVTEVWYPIAGSVMGAELGPVRDAPPDPSRRGAPLVLFVHGSDGSRLGYAYLTEALARAGYVVAAADFPLTALNTPGGASDLHVDEQPGDLVFLADRLRDASADARDPLSGAIDASSYVVAGHSTGGTVALVAAYAPDTHDPRMRGAVALAPCACFFGESFFRTRSVPLMVIAGSDDGFVPVSNNGGRAYRLASAPKVFATLVGGDHLAFTGVTRLRDEDVLFGSPTSAESDIATALSRYGGGTECTPVPPTGTDAPMSGEDQHARTIALVRGFTDGVLRAMPAGLAALEASPEPGVRVVHE